MSEMRQFLGDNAARLFSGLCNESVFAKAERGEWQADLWRALEDNGLSAATRTEHRGGPGSDIGDAFSIVREAGAHCVPAPLTETMLAELALAAAGLAPRNGPASVGPVILDDACSLERVGGRWLLSGTLHRIPWARHVDHLVVLCNVAGGTATVIVPPGSSLEREHNFANEPRDTIRFDRVALDEDSVSLESGLSVMDLRFHGAFFRIGGITGALEKVLDMTVSYAMERKQFGRPIGKFQAVQQQIAIMATQVAAANAAADAMIDAMKHSQGHFEIAAAKARVSEAAGVAAGIAHQVHGAMGFTLEHPLQRSTRRLWSWRDEFGSEHDWFDWLGDIAVRLGSGDLWPFLTSEPKKRPS